MQTEKEYLFEVWQSLDAINRTTDEARKQEMKNHLHQKVYTRKHRYGFGSVEDVRKSVEYLKAGKPDPTEKRRYDHLKRTIEVLKESLSDYEHRQNSKETKLSLGYNKLRSQTSQPDVDLCRE